MAFDQAGRLYKRTSAAAGAPSARRGCRCICGCRELVRGFPALSPRRLCVDCFMLCASGDPGHVVRPILVGRTDRDPARGVR
jgi:hypothetical protein